MIRCGDVRDEGVEKEGVAIVKEIEEQPIGTSERKSTDASIRIPCLTCWINRVQRGVNHGSYDGSS